MHFEVNLISLHKLLHPEAVWLEVLQIAFWVHFRFHGPSPGDQVGAQDDGPSGHGLLVAPVQTTVQSGDHVNVGANGGGVIYG